MMNYLITSITWILITLFSFSVYAVDIPDDDIGATKLNQMGCIDETTQNCINDACETSEEIDCQDNCKKMAQQKCQQEINE